MGLPLYERLHLLQNDLRDLPPSAIPRASRRTSRDRRRCSNEGRAFDPMWRPIAVGHEPTPPHRQTLRAARQPTGRADTRTHIGYASGTSRRDTANSNLAVDPEAHEVASARRSYRLSSGASSRRRSGLGHTQEATRAHRVYERLGSSRSSPARGLAPRDRTS